VAVVKSRAVRVAPCALGGSGIEVREFATTRAFSLPAARSREVIRVRILTVVALSFAAVCSNGANAGASVRAFVPAMLAGTARSDITPPAHGFAGLWLAGFDFRTLPAQAVGRPLYVRALALRAPAATYVFASLDILTVPRSLHDAVMSRIAGLHLAPAAVVLQATHTHSGPVVGDSPDPFVIYDFSTTQDQATARYTNWLAATTATTIARAVQAAVTPVTLGYGVTHLPRTQDFAVNRRAAGAPERALDAGTSGQGTTDIPILAASSPTGLVAVLFGYAAHALIVAGTGAGDPLQPDPLFYQYHPDFPGVAESVLESDFPGAAALYVTGASGDINPSSSVMSGSDPALLPGTHLARAVEEALPALQPLGALAGATTTGAAVPLDRYDLAYFERAAKHNGPWGRDATVVLAQIRDGTLPVAAQLYFSLWHFAPGTPQGSPLYLIAMSGEPLVHWSLAFKRGALGVPGNAWLAGYANDACCYVPSDSTVIYPGYETGWRREPDTEYGWVVSGSMLYYAKSSRMRPGSIDGTVLPAVRSLAR
jgi:hypothetical protein